MSWDRKSDRRLQYIKRKKSRTNSKSKRFKKIKKDVLKYKDDKDDLNKYT